MSQLIKIQLDKWLPDYIPFGMPPGGLVICKNLIPYPGKFIPFRQTVRYSSNTVADTALSGYEAMDNTATRYSYIGTASKLYRLETSKALTDVSIAGGYTTGTNRWSFEQYNQWIIATNYADVPQILKGLTTANFQNLGGSPPRAKYVLFFKGHLILGYLNDGTVYPNKLIWSARESIEDFTQALSTGSDYQQVAEIKGEITGLGHNGEVFFVFSTNSIEMGYYSQSPYTFNLQPKFWGVGALAGSVAQYGDILFFFDDRDIYSLQAGQLTPIGEGVRETVLDSINQNYKNRITNAVDVRNGLIFWSYPSTASLDGTPDKILCYNQKINKFSLIEINHNCIFNAAKVSVDIDGLDAYSTTIDGLPWATDSIYYQAMSSFACIDTDKYVSNFLGRALTGVIEPGEFNADDSIFMIKRIRPRVQKAIDPITVKLGTRMNEVDDFVYTSGVNVAASGYANILKSARYARCNIQTGLHEGILDILAEGDLISRY